MIISTLSHRGSLHLLPKLSSTKCYQSFSTSVLKRRHHHLQQLTLPLLFANHKASASPTHKDLLLSIKRAIRYPTPLHHRKYSSSAMPPTSPPNLEAVKAKIDELIGANQVVIFSKTYCPFCTKVKKLFSDLKFDFQAIELDTKSPEECAVWESALQSKSNQRTFPNVFIKGQHIGGCDDTFKMHNQKKLIPLLEGRAGPEEPTHSFDYDLVVIGGGSGGLAASKAAGLMGKKVAVCDYVNPTPSGTEWGLGGTCVNVGCIPKKLMHQAAILGQAVKQDAPAFGWDLGSNSAPEHKWSTLVDNVQMYIKSLNWGYRVQLRDASVNYLNEYAKFLDAHTIETTNKKGEKQRISADKFLVAVGGRPKYPEGVPGALEHAITSDDIFSLPHHPGKVLCIGASYIALECAGFLAGLGIQTEVMVRSILLRGFDQQIAGLIGSHMESYHGLKFHRGWVPTEIIKVENGSPPKLIVRAKRTTSGGGEDENMEVEVNTVLIAVGREACTKSLNLENAGVEFSKSSGKIVTNEQEQTSAPHIYAIGDVAEGKPELTPVAIQAGVGVAKRLFAGSQVLTDYDKIPTTVFTPLEYGCVGLAEEEAIKRFGSEDVEVYHSNFTPLEATLAKRDENKSYCKLVCVKSQNERVVGFHYLGPNAGEVTQGFALGMKLGATKLDFDGTIGIHPTTAETFTTLGVTKSSGLSALKTGC